MSQIKAILIFLLMLSAVISGCATTKMDFEYNNKIKPSNMYKGIDIDLKVNNFDYGGNLLTQYEGLGPKPSIMASGNVAKNIETALRESMERFGIRQSGKSQYRIEIDVESLEAKFKWGTWIGNTIYKISLYNENDYIYSGKAMAYDSRFNMWGLKSGKDALNEAFTQSIDKVSWKDIEKAVIASKYSSESGTNYKKTKPSGMYGNVGVIGFEELNVTAKSEKLGAIITRMMETSIYNCRKFRLIERRNLDQILIEQKFQLSGIVANDSIVQIGKIAGVDFLLLGSVSKISDEIIIDFKIVNTENASVFYAGSTNSKNVNNIRDTISYLMNSL